MSAAPESLRERIARGLAAARAEFAAATSPALLEGWRVRWLGRKGTVAELFAALASADPSERRELGQLLNAFKQVLQALHDGAAPAERATVVRTVDASLPGRRPWVGRAHILSQVLDEMQSIFVGLGFSVASGPEVELEEYNFAALNFPPNHPARDLQDTFYVDDRLLLRTQTSPTQVRIMRSQPPPVRVVVPGRVYRNEQIDATHAAEFHQLEGLYVDKAVSMVDLKATIAYFSRRMFGDETRVRFKPHYFPFTEPSVDVDMTCFACAGRGCKLCGGSGWIEIMGAGMVHPNVFTAAGYDPEQVTGFAFGMGVDRIAMLKHGIDDLRLLLENDVRFLAQF
ncbi:MAG TPA: phenylalanine--tRNA ligase subunit alpha [Candidatus Krumholzibacteria bacterium]|nr:phenylalanine--tRNA ligase subunit alpha [Candidatus Krumholzibacteria bacterium]